MFLPEQTWRRSRLLQKTRDSWSNQDDGLPMPLLRIEDLRSTAGADAADEQFSEFNVASSLGHADSKVTAKHYIKRKLDDKRQISVR